MVRSRSFRGPLPRYCWVWRFVHIILDQGEGWQLTRCRCDVWCLFLVCLFISISVNTLSMQVYTNCQGSDKYWRSIQLIQSLSMFECQGDLFQCELPDLPDARYSHTQDNLTGTLTCSLAHLLIDLFSPNKWPLIGHQHISSLKWQLVVATPERTASLWTPHQDSGGQHNFWLTDMSPIKTAIVG